MRKECRQQRDVAKLQKTEKVAKDEVISNQIKWDKPDEIILSVALGPFWVSMSETG